MELGIYTDSVSNSSFEECLDFAVDIGVRGIEIAAGGQSNAPHMSIGALLADSEERRKFSKAFADRDLTISALNCSAWPMHPVVGDEHLELMKDTIRLAQELGVKKIVTMSGNPGDGPTATTINWVWYPWPADAVALHQRQWDEATRVWEDLASFAVNHGVTQVALELHPLHLVYNVPTLMKMREAVGPVIGANVDPSHMFWQQMDPIQVVRALGEAVYHVHLKDTEIIRDQVAVAGVLDSRPFRDPTGRAWVFRTVGRGHGTDFWNGFIAALNDVGYHGVLSIENEDPSQPDFEGVEEAARFIGGLLAQPM